MLELTIDTNADRDGYADAFNEVDCSPQLSIGKNRMNFSD
jgi:hypothetical protein